MLENQKWPLKGENDESSKYSIYLSDILDEYLLGLLSCWVRHHKLISEITKHPHTNTKCVTAEELWRTRGTKIVTTLTNVFDKFTTCNRYITHKGQPTFMGGCCEWQKSFTLFCKQIVASVRITH